MRWVRGGAWRVNVARTGTNHQRSEMGNDTNRGLFFSVRGDEPCGACTWMTLPTSCRTVVYSKMMDAREERNRDMSRGGPI